MKIPRPNAKGRTPWNKNKKGLQVAWNKGMKFPNKPHSGFIVGHKHTDISKKKISDTLKKRIITDKHRENIRKSLSGKPQLNHRGENNHNWKGGVTPENQKIRHSLEYKLWRNAVFIRDNYTCIWCGQMGGKLNADHIKPFALYPELRFSIDNGRTLCVDCHKTTETFGGKFMQRMKLQTFIN
jgi:5-methylcytosine-specific restriction endonuclease McrA